MSCGADEESDVDTYLRCYRDTVPTPAKELAKLRLSNAHTVHGSNVKMSDARVVGNVEQAPTAS